MLKYNNKIVIIKARYKKTNYLEVKTLIIVRLINILNFLKKRIFY
jgi:hypothetical protein